MTNPILKTLTTVSERAATALKDGAGTSISHLYRDTGERTEGVIKRTTESDLSSKHHFDGIHDKMDVDEPEPVGSASHSPGQGGPKSPIAKILDPEGAGADEEMADLHHYEQSGGVNRKNRPQIQPNPADPATWWDADNSRPGRADGLVLSGHGGWEEADGYARVPKGTIVHLYTNHGQVIPDDLGGRVETGDASGANFESYRGPGSSRWVKGGQNVPNYTISPPEGLTIQGSPVIAHPAAGGGFDITTDPGTPHAAVTHVPSLTDPATKMPVGTVHQHSVTFDGPVRLSDILTEDMGHVHIAACNFVETGRPGTRNQGPGLFNPPGGSGR